MEYVSVFAIRGGKGRFSMVSVEKISEATGLDVEDIEDLKKKI